MARTVSQFDRPKPRFKQHPTILVICEDSKSGLNYLKDASRYFRIEVKVEVSHCDRTDPKGIVEEALKRQTQFDRVYCVIDRDSHPSFDEAVLLARKSKKIAVVDSHPCFEYWFLLHFKYNRKSYNAIGKSSAADKLIKELCKQPDMDKYDKGKDQGVFMRLHGNFATARKNAALALADAFKVGNLNPSTKLHLLMDDFDRLSDPLPIE